MAYFLNQNILLLLKSENNLVILSYRGGVMGGGGAGTEKCFHDVWTGQGTGTKKCYHACTNHLKRWTYSCVQKLHIFVCTAVQGCFL